MAVLVLIVLAGFAYYIMTPEERARVARTAVGAARRLADTAVRRSGKPEPFGEALRERTPRVFVTPALIVLNAAVFVSMLAGFDPLADPETLVHWGGNFGPRTTNGEWWRLVTAMFVHSGLLHLLANMIGLLLAGVVLERLVGPVAFAGVYFATGTLTSLVSLSAHPVSVNVGASGAIFGVYGLLLATLVWGLIRRSTLTIPLSVVTKLAPAAFVFLLYHVATHGLRPTAEFAGLVAGFIFGIVSARGVSECKPPARRLAAAAVGTVVIVVISAAPLRGLCDVMPEIERIVALEAHTARAYQVAVDQFKLGGVTGRTLAQVIDRTIVPQLQTSSARLKALTKVPAEHQALVADIEAYLRLRDRSWRLRAEALQKSNTVALRQADEMERASLDALGRIRPALRLPS
jgi:rhomboid protease GluP